MNTYGVVYPKKRVIITAKSMRAIRRSIPFFLLASFFVMSLTMPDTVRLAVSFALELCVSRLIPSLFPFMIAGEIFFALGGHTPLAKALGKPFTRLFGISGNGAGAFILGAVCGLPLGGKYAVLLYENGDITKAECEMLMGICNNAGIGFTVMGIGYSLWGSASFGFVLYAVQIFSSIMAGVIMTNGIKKEKKSPLIAPTTDKKQQNTFTSALSDATVSSSVNMLKICGFVVFFSVICSFLSVTMSFLGLPRLLSCTASSFLEITFAASNLRELYNCGTRAAIEASKTLTFFAIGFSGMSAHAQLSSFSSRLGLGMKKYYLTKLLCGVICAFTGAIVLLYLGF